MSQCSSWELFWVWNEFKMQRCALGGMKAILWLYKRETYHGLKPQELFWDWNELKMQSYELGGVKTLLWLDQGNVGKTAQSLLHPIYQTWFLNKTIRSGRYESTFLIIWGHKTLKHATINLLANQLSAHFPSWLVHIDSLWRNSFWC